MIRVRAEVFLSLIAIVLVLLSSCGGGKDFAVTVEYWTHEDSARKALEERLIAEFEKENPGIDVIRTEYGSAELLEMINAAFDAGEGPDLFNLPSEEISSLLGSGKLARLDAASAGYESVSALEEAYADGSFDAVTSDGDIYGLPLEYTNWCLYVNRRLFEENGLDPDSPPSTWEEVVELAKQLTIDEDGNGTPEVFGLGIGQVSRPFQMLTMPESLGGQPIGDDGTVTGVLTTEPWLKAGQFIQDLFNTWNVSPKGVSASDMLAYFVSEKVAMLIGPDYNYLSYSQNDELEWDYAPYPYFAEGTPVTPTGSWSLGINSNSQHKDAAAKLIKFLTLNPVCIEWFKMDGHLPANKTTIEYINSEPMYDEWPHNIFDLLQYESANTAVPRPLSAGYLEYENMLTTAFEDIRNGADVKTTLEQVEVRIDRALSRYN